MVPKNVSAINGCDQRLIYTPLAQIILKKIFNGGSSTTQIWSFEELFDEIGWLCCFFIIRSWAWCVKNIYFYAFVSLVETFCFFFHNTRSSFSTRLHSLFHFSEAWMMTVSSVLEPSCWNGADRNGKDAEAMHASCHFLHHLLFLP